MGILVVEDEAIIAHHIRATLESIGYGVFATADSAESATRAVADEKPDLVLMDIRLKGETDGIDTAVQIRRRWDVPIIFLTSHSDEGTLSRAKAIGPHGYLLKPFNDRDLRISIEIALRKHALESSLSDRHRAALEQRRTDRREATADRIASVATMAAGMAHEFNNPLSVVLGNVAVALHHLSEAKEAAAARDPRITDPIDDALHALADANEAGTRVRRLIADLRRVARADHVDATVLDLPDVLDAALAVTAPPPRDVARVERAYGTTPFVFANESRLVQVFVNILSNAAQAVNRERPDENHIRIVTRTDPAGRALVEIQDDGQGIAQWDLNRAFDPFFSTKPVGAGMGLGLSVCHGIVTSLGGEISLSSELGRGTVCRVALPPATEEALKEATAATERSGKKRGRILVVDDDDTVSRTIERVLRREHDVTVEADAREALRRIAGGETFDVVFCDLMMPIMSGMAFYQALHPAQPDLAARIVFVTGGAVSAASEQFLSSIENDVLAKPFTGEALLDAARSRVR